VAPGQSGLTVNVKVGSTYSFASSQPANPINGSSANSMVANVFDAQNNAMATGTFYAATAGTASLQLQLPDGSSRAGHGHRVVGLS